MRVVVTGGGTGGHIYPALAVAAALKSEDPACEVRYIGGTNGMEAAILPASGLPYHLVRSKKLCKILSINTIGAMLSLFRGYREASVYLKSFRPDVVISTGGYTAAATALAAAKQKVPTIIQEYNAVPGRTNRWLSKRASKICVWFEETTQSFPGAKSVITGVPLREGIVCNLDSRIARKELGLDPDLFTVLILGGSQGSKRLNELTLELAHQMDAPLQILHQTGDRNLDAAISQAAKVYAKKANYQARAFLSSTDISLAYKAADMLTCRCGISTLAEACVNGVPALLIPLPTAYADHQTANAKVLARHGAGIHLPEASLTAVGLVEQVEFLMNDSVGRDAIGQAACRLGKPNAARDVARLAISLTT